MPGGNLKPRIVSKKINTITGKIILTNNKYKNLLSPQQYETKTDRIEIAKKKSKVFEIKINNRKLIKVRQKGLGNFFSLFQGFLVDKKYTIKVNPIIKINNALGKVAGCIPLFKIGGTISKEKVDISKIVEINIIKKETLNSSLKKKGKLLFALFCFRTFFIN